MSTSEVNKEENCVNEDFTQDENFNSNEDQNHLNGNQNGGDVHLNGNENHESNGNCNGESNGHQNGITQETNVKKQKTTDQNALEPEYFRKVFVGSLNYSTTEDKLREHFIKFGELVDCVIMKESKSGKSRGFGFVTYSKSTMVDEMMKNRPHKLDGRELETKRATPREEAGKPGAEMTTKKLFVGAIKEGMTEEHLKEYFSKYGKIEDAIVMKEKDSNKSRGFGFVTFDDYDPVDRIVLEKFHTVNGQNVAVKKALPKEQTVSGRNARDMERERGGGGGGYNHNNMNGGRNHRGNMNHNYNENFNRFNDYNDDFNSNNFNDGGGFNSFSNNSPGGFGLNPPTMPGGGMGNMNFANFAMMAQKMLQNMGQQGNAFNPSNGVTGGFMGGGGGTGMNNGNFGAPMQNMGQVQPRNQMNGAGRRGGFEGPNKSGGPIRNGNARRGGGPYGGRKNK